MNSVRYTGVPRSLCGVPFKAAAVNSKSASLIFSVLLFGALFGFCQTVRAEPGKPLGNVYADSEYSALRDFVQLIGVDNAKPKLVSNKESGNPHSQIEDEAYSALREFAQRVGAGQPEPVTAPEQKFAAADNAFDALRDFLQKGAAQPKSTLGEQSNAQAAAPKTAAIDATYVGEKVCMTCHASQAAAFGQTLMGKIGKTQPGKFACENCHGPGSAHVKAGGGRGVGGILSFGKTDPRSVEERNGVCLGCHQKGDRTLWVGSTHETRDLACTNCHTVMKNVTRKSQLAMPTEQETCFQCHKNKRAETWRTAHMPVREGKMTCTSCHNPHGSFSESLLKEASVNDTCYKCHAERRGPFLFEHAPVRESCVNCHDPHGSTNEFLLKVSRPRLCQQCHGTLTGHPGNPRNPQSVFALNRECQNCHSQIHGSNSPAGARFQR